MIFLIANWKSILTAIITGVIAFGLHTLDVYRLEAKETADLQAEATEMIDKCKTNEAITSGVSNDYEKKIDALNTQLAALSLQHVCVPVSAPKPPAGNHGSPQASKPAQPDAVDPSTLYAFAADAEKYRITLIECQSFITQTWKSQ